MYRKVCVVLLVVIIWPVVAVYATDITTLLEAAARHPNVYASDLAVQEGNLRQAAVTDRLYPKVGLFGKAELYNSPTNLRPMPPTEVNVLAGEGLPFSREIMRYGLSFQMPLYVGAIYRLREKMCLLAQKSQLARRINLVSRQSTVVSLNSAYNLLIRLEQSIDARLRSLDKTREDVAIKVKNGRVPEAEMMKIDNSVIIFKQHKNDLAAKVMEVQRGLEEFTNLVITEPIKMTLVVAPVAGDFIAVNQQKIEVAAQKKEMARVRAGYRPILSLYGTVSGNDGKTYNTDDHIFRSYNFAGIVFNMPLFDKTINSAEDIASVQVRQAEMRLQELQIELTALEKNLRKRLPIIDTSLRLAAESTKNNDNLLVIARVTYDSGRITTEEYLRYEARLLASKADMAKAKDEKWQVIAKQAVLYGIDLKGVVQ